MYQHDEEVCWVGQGDWATDAKCHTHPVFRFFLPLPPEAAVLPAATPAVVVPGLLALLSTVPVPVPLLPSPGDVRLASPEPPLPGGTLKTRLMPDGPLLKGADVSGGGDAWPSAISTSPSVAWGGEW